MALQRSKEKVALGQAIRRARQARNIGIREAAEMCHMDRGHLSRIENGWLEPPLRRLRKIALVVGVPVPTLLSGRKRSA